LRFDTRETVTAPSRVVNKLDLEEGELHNLQELRQDIHEQSSEMLPDLARSHLSQYTKTTGEFLEHFTRKGYPENLVREVMTNLEQEGFLDDEKVARLHVEQRVANKSYGQEKIIAELREKGIDSGKARRLVRQVYPEEAARRNAREYIEKNDDLAPKKLMSRLQNRGFSSSIIRELVSFSS
ncbi:MAG: regulatory protein RecX, partial [bacterium]